MKSKIHHSKPTLCIKDAGLFKSVLASSQIASGSIARDFEKKFSDYIGCAGAVATNSGTSALHLALSALGVKGGDEVIVPSYVCVSIVDAINYVGARPVLTDIDYNTLNISIKDARRKLTKKTRALIIPHMFGLPCDIDQFLRIGLPLIEDCAQSLGAKYKNKLTGSFGAISVFSFYATKLITTGYGGMVTADSKKLLERIKDLNEPDKRGDYKVRYNYKMSDLQAALGIDQLESLKSFIRKRQAIAKEYTRLLSSYDLKLPSEGEGRTHIFYRYVVKTKKAGLIKKCFLKNGIEVMPPVYKPLHRYLALNKKDFPNTERVYREAVSLPIYPALKREEYLKVIRVLAEAVSI